MVAQSLGVLKRRAEHFYCLNPKCLLTRFRTYLALQKKKKVIIKILH